EAKERAAGIGRDHRRLMLLVVVAGECPVDVEARRYRRVAARPAMLDAERVAERGHVVGPDRPGAGAERDLLLARGIANAPTVLEEAAQPEVRADPPGTAAMDVVGGHHALDRALGLG